jgi:hypothetical protein
VFTPAATDDTFYTPPSSSYESVEDENEAAQARPSGQKPNLAPRAHEISATPSNDNVLPEGSKRERKKRRLTQSVMNDEELSEFRFTFSAALIQASRAQNEPNYTVITRPQQAEAYIHI